MSFLKKIFKGSLDKQLLSAILEVPDKVEKLLMKGANPNSISKNGTPALIIACKQNKIELVKSLLKHGANVNQKDSSTKSEGFVKGDTPLITAIRQGNFELVNELLKNKADTEQRNDNEETALIVAAYSDLNDILIQTLIDNGADVNAANCFEETALMRATDKLFISKVKLLLQNGADVNAQEDNGSTALITAVSLYEEVKGEQIEEAKLDTLINCLIDYGADVNAALNTTGDTVLMEAIDKGAISAVKILLERGANANIVSELYGCGPLLFAIENAYKFNRKDFNELINLLIKHGARVNERKSYDGSTPLMHAARNGLLSTVRMLLKNGADSKIKTNKGDTALDIVLFHIESFMDEVDEDYYKIVSALEQAFPSKQSKYKTKVKGRVKGIPDRHNYDDLKGLYISIKYKDLAKVIFPIVLHICYPKGEDDSSKYFDASCPNCGMVLNAKGLAYSASLTVTAPDKSARGCPGCRNDRLKVQLKRITREEMDRLRKDKFFSKLLPT